MIIEISPLVYSIGFAFAFALCGFMIARFAYRQRQEDIIEDTIYYLVENNFCKARKQGDELELIKLNSDD